MKNKKCEHKNTKIEYEEAFLKTQETCLDCGAFRFQDEKSKRWYLWINPVKTIEEDFL